MRKFILSCLFVFPFYMKAEAQDSFSVRAQRYIEQYYSLAMKEQMRSGVPASVTLAQGVLETEAGRSELACMANNHFGIKCKADYSGQKFYHDDDAPKECFKMYRSAEDSYVDHSDYLKRNPRYNPLFTLSITDYAAWAMGLKRCGYATSPTYAQRLIKIIEDFRLQQYTYSALDSLGINVPPKFAPNDKDKFQVQSVAGTTNSPAVAARLAEQDKEKPQLQIKAVTPTAPPVADTKSVGAARLSDHEKEKPQVQINTTSPGVALPVANTKSVAAARLSDHEKEKPEVQIGTTAQPVQPVAGNGAARLSDHEKEKPQVQVAVAPAVVAEPQPVAQPVAAPVAVAQPITKIDTPATATSPAEPFTPAPKDTIPPPNVAVQVQKPVLEVKPLPKADTVVAAVTQPAITKAEVPVARDTAKPTPIAAEKPMIAAVMQSAPPAPAPPPADTQQKNAPLAANDARYDSGKVIVVNGLKAFYARKGEMLLQYAVKYNIRYPHLLEINDLPDAALTENTLVYLEKKLNTGTHIKHTVREEETIFSIAQSEGMVLKRLLALNMLDPGEEPAAGTILELQNGATRKPTLRATPPPDLKTAHNLSYVKPTPADNYVNIERHATEPAETNTTAAVKDISRDKFVSTIQVGIDTAQQAANIAAKQAVDTTLQATDPVAVVAPATTNKALDSLLTAEKTDSAADELAALKARLDKVVYTHKDATNQPPKVEQQPVVDTANQGTIKLTTTIYGPVVPKKEKQVKQQQTGAGAYYTVKKGDNFSRIAQKNHVSVNQIMKLNHIEPDELKPGQKIRIR